MTDDDDRIDFSPLDPAADGARWERVVDATVQKALDAAAAREAWWQALFERRRAIAVVASLTLAAGVFALVQVKPAHERRVPALLAPGASDPMLLLEAVGGGR